MQPISNYLNEQYELVQDSRKVLLAYCQTIAPADFINENRSFGRGGSIRNLLTHIANTYQFWIEKHGLGRTIVFTSYNSINTVDEVVELFKTIDMFVIE